MASLTGQSVASSYEQLLHVDRDGGGNGSTLVDIKDGDNGTTFALQLATDKINVNGDVTIIDSADDANGGILNLKNDRATPADNDEAGRIYMYADDDANNATEAILMIGRMTDVSNGSEDSDLRIYTYNDGASQNTLHLTSGVVSLPKGQLQFPESQNESSDANTLDDYEEGEHTTTITGTTSGSWVLDSAQNKLSYTKIGRLVTVIGKFETDSGSGAGTLKISMPFTAANLTSGAGIAAGSITINRYGSTSIATQITPIIFEGNNFINVQIHSTDGTSNESYVQADDIDAIFEGQLSITYFTD